VLPYNHIDIFLSSARKLFVRWKKDIIDAYKTDQLCKQK